VTALAVPQGQSRNSGLRHHRQQVMPDASQLECSIHLDYRSAPQAYDRGTGAWVRSRNVRTRSRPTDGASSTGALL
jgi:hypothetical protein